MRIPDAKLYYIVHVSPTTFLTAFFGHLLHTDIFVPGRVPEARG